MLHPVFSAYTCLYIWASAQGKQLRMDEWVDIWVDGWVDGWMDGWMDG